MQEMSGGGPADASPLCPPPTLKMLLTPRSMPSSNNTISLRISDMAEDVLKQLLHCIEPVDFANCSWMSQQMWPTWHMSWFMCGTFMKVQLRGHALLQTSGKVRTTGEDNVKLLDTFATSNGLMWTQCVGICTDRAWET